MKIYIDCVSGYSHLVELLKRFEELGKDLKNSEKVWYMILLRKFQNCYFEGSVSSRCSRSVIEIQVLLSNLKTVIEQTEMENTYENRLILDAAFKGIRDNCADGSDSYIPEEQ